MFIRLLNILLLFIVIVQSIETDSSKGQSSISTPVLPKTDSLYDDYDLNDKKSNGEGSGGGLTNLDEYADEEENDQLSKITETTTTSSTISTTTISKQNESTTKNNDLDNDEFNEDYKDDVENDIDYNEITQISSTLSSTTLSLSTVKPSTTPIRLLFKFLTRPPIAAGILAGLAIGILTSVILLLCLVQRIHKRQRTQSSYTTGLLYPNQYGYSKSPQEFYA